MQREIDNETDWLLAELATGLQKLACLSLDRTPAAEMLLGTAHAWLDAVTDGRDWDEARDAGRVAAAFRTLSRTARRWPAPAEFLDAIPAVAAPLAIGRESRPASPEAVQAHADRIRSLLADVVIPAPPARVERETTPEQRAKIKEELRHHYRGKAAAAGPDA